VFEGREETPRVPEEPYEELNLIYGMAWAKPKFAHPFKMANQYCIHCHTYIGHRKYKHQRFCSEYCKAQFFKNWYPHSNLAKKDLKYPIMKK
jgi:hypothetical protein